MNDWIKDVKAGLERRDEVKERAQRLELHRRELTQSKASLFFSDLMRSAEDGVVAMRSHKEFAKVAFEELSPTNFKVRNGVYPIVTVDVHLLPDGIRFKRTTAKDARSDVIKEEDQIDFAIDPEDNLTLTNKGQPVAGKDEALHLMLDSVFRL